MSVFVDIHKKLGNFTLNSKISAENEVMGILGSSGCGKSMTLKCIAGIVTPDEGEIIVNGRVLFSSEKKINLTPQMRNTGLMFQSYALFPNITVEQNIGIGVFEKSKHEKKKIVDFYLELLKIEDLKSKYPAQLSGGQQQRVALARMMAKKPDILMFDEPLSALDFSLKHSLETEFLNILKGYSGSVLYVSHSIDEIYTYCDKISIMSAGRILETNNKESIFEAPTTIEGAKILGCRNISKIKKISDNLAMALDWGISFAVPDFSDDIKYIGIREADITITDKQDGENSFEFNLSKVRHMPSGSMVYLRPAFSTAKGELLCNYQKDKFHSVLSMEKQGKLYAKVKKDSILLLK